MWIVISCVLSVVLSVGSLAVALFAVRLVRAVAASPPLNTRSLLLRIESTENSLQETQATLAELANRVKMQKVRNAIGHVKRDNGEPDVATDPEGWRAWKNRQLRGV